MELALIPPISYLEHTNLCNMQLMLPQLVTSEYNKKYSDTYKELGRDPSQYVILDNGAAEDEQVTSEILLRIAEDFKVDEVAVPDVLADGTATIDLADKFFAGHANDIKRINSLRGKSLKFGLVTQGHSIDDALYTVFYALTRPWGHNIKVLYLPRLIIRESGNIWARIELLNKLQSIYGDRFEYHFFGAAREWPTEIIEASNFNYLRSMDTSLPYLLSYYGINPHVMYSEVVRPEDYFNQPSIEFKNPLDYVDHFIKWSKGLAADE